MAAAKARVHLIITGRVQGVAFRYSAQDKAEELGVYGWVRNRRDGTVEAVAEGDKDLVDAFVKWCRKGPAIARVVAVDVEWEEYKGEFKNFYIAHTV